MATRTFVPGLASGIKHVIALTGTPIINRPVEAFTLLQALRPDEYDNFFSYAKRYCGAEKTQYGWDFSGCTNAPELRERLKDVMVRRTKDQVLTDLPAKRRVTIDVELTNRDDYDAVQEAAEEALQEAVESRNAGEALRILNQLRRLAGQGKVGPAIEWIEEFVAGGGSLIVFAHHKDILDAVQAALGEAGVTCVRVDGDVPVAARQAAVDAFQAGTAQVFLGTPGAAGVGLTLTKAQDVLFIERQWTPALEEQAEDRAHRIGQKGSVTAWYLVAAESIDDRFNALVEKKRAVIGAVMDGKDLADQGEDEGGWMWDLAERVLKGDDY